MAFLRFLPFSIKNYWQRLVKRPLDQGSASGIARLQIRNNVALCTSDLKSLLTSNSFEGLLRIKAYTLNLIRKVYTSNKQRRSLPHFDEAFAS
ncbi:hypothetical protein KFK09_019535 [Dendrobium nobile]|uniref:Uncharacterized protein n=1 Tax=Dendrobium nobile TaxID=94219 RepID=A0A8T3AWZ4_DENNO|nr:hypothetical protein KFK09_019535 [Dendrobium nobile]